MSCDPPEPSYSTWSAFGSLHDVSEIRKDKLLDELCHDGQLTTQITAADSRFSIPTVTSCLDFSFP